MTSATHGGWSASGCPSPLQHFSYLQQRGRGFLSGSKFNELKHAEHSIFTSHEITEFKKKKSVAEFFLRTEDHESCKADVSLLKDNFGIFQSGAS